MNEKLFYKYKSSNESTKNQYPRPTAATTFNLQPWAIHRFRLTVTDLHAALEGAFEPRGELGLFRVHVSKVGLGRGARGGGVSDLWQLRQRPQHDVDVQHVLRAAMSEAVLCDGVCWVCKQNGSGDSIVKYRRF